MKILSGSSNLSLAQNIAQHLGHQLIDVELSHFANGEKRVWLKETVRGENVILIQSFSEPADEQIVEFLLLTDALERAGARHINLVLPWMGYSLQDKVFRDGEPIAAKVIANLVSNVYIKRAFLLDLHNSSTAGFFSIPTQHLTAMNLFVAYVKKNFHISPEKFVVASPDFGGLKRAHIFAEELGLDLLKIDKRRDVHTGKVSSESISGDVTGKEVFIFDDLINTGSTIVSSAELLKNNGAKAVHFFATHGIFAENGYERIEKSLVDTVVVTNSIAQKNGDKLRVLDTAPVFAEALTTWVGVK